MSLLNKESKALLVSHMRNALTESVKKNKALTESAVTEGIKYVNESCTYEQLLNLTMNPLQESKYLPDYVCEGAAIILGEAMMTGRKVIGLNAITEGALNLQKKMPEATITEAMLECALAAAQTPALQMVGGIITEAVALEEGRKEEMFKKGDKAAFEKQYGAGSFDAYKKSNLKATQGKRMTKAAKDFKKAHTTSAAAAKAAGEKAGLKGQELKNYVSDHAGSMTAADKKTLAGLEKRAAGARKAQAVARGKTQQAAQTVAKKGLGKGGKIALGLAGTAGLVGGAAAIKKWHDKKQQMKAAASKAK